MFDYHEQTSSFDLKPSRPVQPANTRLRNESPRSYARSRSFPPLKDVGVIQEGQDPSGCAYDRRPLFTEELAHLRPVLKTLGCVVVCSLESEVAPHVIFGESDCHCSDGLEAKCLIAPGAFLFRPNGQLFGVLGSLFAHSTPSDSVVSVLEALLRHASRSISERWFRLHYRENWIVAAAPVSKPDQGVLLAMDKQMNLRAVGFGATELLGTPVQGTISPRWDDLFTPVTPTMRGKADLPMRLTEVRNGRPWIALLSGPDFRATEAWSSDALAHTRPRLHQLAGLALSKWEAPSNAPSLTTGMRRRIEDFIEARLNMPLSVEEIAQAAGLSSSYFTRAFRNVLKMTPHRYVMWRRLVKAQELIKGSKASLAEIAATTGFADQSHLCHLFQQHLGESPNRYRRRCR